MFSFFDFLCFSKCRRLSYAARRRTRNIVIFGSLGVGKSSLVNMLIGSNVAPVSNAIRVAHRPIVEYTIPLKEISGDSLLDLHPSSSELTLKFYDTVGLDHRRSPWRAIKACMRRSGGADLILYCMRQGRLTSEQTTHLRDIWETFCRGDVPLVLVVCGTDYRRGSTEEWWEENGEKLTNAVQGTTYEETQKHVRDLVVRHCTSLHSVS